MSLEVSIFKFDSNEVHVAVDDKGVPWFVAGEVASALGYSETSKGLLHTRKPAILGDVNKINNLHPSTKWISESDVYRMVMKSHLPSAERFQDWVCEEVLPSIRKTGSYALGKDKEWAEIRQDGKSARKDFVREIGQRGAKTPKDYAMLTDKVNVAATGLPARELKKAIAHFDGITDAKKVQNIAVRDNLNGEMLSRLILVERGSTNRMIAQDAKSVSQCGQAVEDVGLMLEALMAGKTLQIV